MRLKKALATLIEQERVCRVATANPSGIPHVVPVCHVLADGKLYFGSAADAKKVVNLKINPRAALTVDLYSDAWAHLKASWCRAPPGCSSAGRAFARRARSCTGSIPIIRARRRSRSRNP